MMLLDFARKGVQCRRAHEKISFETYPNRDHDRRGICFRRSER